MPRDGEQVERLDQYKKFPAHTVRAIEMLWTQVPNLRFGQLLAMVVKDTTELFQIENAELIDKIDQYVRDLNK